MEREEFSLRIRQASIAQNGRTAVGVGRTVGFIDPLSCPRLIASLCSGYSAMNGLTSGLGESPARNI